MSCYNKTLNVSVQMKNSTKKSTLRAFVKVQITKDKSNTVKGGTTAIIIEEIVTS